MNRFEKIKNDKTIIEVYNRISEFEDLDKGWAHHNFHHVKNVAKLIESLLSELGYDDSFIEEAKIAALLHDAGAIEGKNNHSLRSYEFAKKYFEKNNIILENKDLVLEAIKIHSGGFDSDNIIALALILSDKLDIKYTRVAKEGYKVKGMKELKYIKDILVEINNKNLEIKFVCHEKINKNELEEFYFMEKVFRAIIAFSKKMNLNPKVLFNNEEWEIFHMLQLLYE
ncbi:HD domain-containing protein [Clostridium paraputrificum]|uniref:HD domain-containing protein n=1 Tax=Clostridium paraputrificum TaxID=29363 RepID=UPI000C07AF13|nr:HD domain-containing protein [Clostridium paraputrificum]MDB2087615.1 HD domain-containing protein [Clostridium paraputrificum]